MLLRIKTFFVDFNRGRNYIFVPGSLPTAGSTEARRSSGVAVASTTSSADSGQPTRAS